MNDSGSAPTVRGILSDHSANCFGIRVSPTYVGNMNKLILLLLIHQGQPHMRGEYATLTACAIWFMGSAPHAWGMHSKNNKAKISARVSPDCAGNTHSKLAFLNRIRGSASHAWGILHSFWLGVYCGRVSSTCVGSTKSAWSLSAVTWGQPHMRGEYTNKTP